MLFLYLSSHSQSIQDLDFLIGTWDTSDLIYPGTDRAYTEKGTRECGYYLDGAYIKCETWSNLKGKSRMSTFLYSYDKSGKFFRLIKIYSTYDLYELKKWVLDQETKTILESDLTGQTNVGTFSFEDRDKLVWSGWQIKKGKTPSLHPIFTETITRK